MNNATCPWTKVYNQRRLCCLPQTETEGFICGIQDQITATKSYLIHIIKYPNIKGEHYRMCAVGEETVEHLYTSCITLAPNENTSSEITKARFIKSKEVYYKQLSVRENDIYNVHWDSDIKTDHTVPHNRPW